MKPTMRKTTIQRRNRNYTECYFDCPICGKETILGNEEFLALPSKQRVICQFCRNLIAIQV
jgi:transcription elongation factor Elf1